MRLVCLACAKRLDLVDRKYNLVDRAVPAVGALCRAPPFGHLRCRDTWDGAGNGEEFASCFGELSARCRGQAGSREGSRNNLVLPFHFNQELSSRSLELSAPNR